MVQNNRVEMLWLDFKKSCIHESVQEPMVEAIKVAFYGGATVLFHEIVNMMTSGLEPSQEDLDNMDSINNELKNFSARLKKGKDWIGVHGVVN